MLRWLHEVRATEQTLAGGKGANLGELLHLGLPVPPGFVITTAAYRAHLERRCDPAGAPGELELDPALSEAVRKAYRQMGSPLVAVRSSATGEDSLEASFAGQQETFLNVAGEEPLLRAIRQCWASLWNQRAVAYREQMGIGHDPAAMAVVVQEMLPAEAAGVMFTVDPVGRRSDRLLIEAAPGLGEAVVSGAVTGDSYRVQRGADLTVSERAVHHPGQPVLSDRQVIELAQIGLQLEAHFGHPQDVEFALTGGRIWLLQTRPITTGIAAEPEPLPPPVRRNPAQRFMLAMGRERYPVAPKPLDNLFVSLLIEAMTEALREAGMTASERDLAAEKARLWRPQYLGIPPMGITWRFLLGPWRAVELLARDWQYWWDGGPSAQLAEVSALPPLEGLTDEELFGLCDRILAVGGPILAARMVPMGAAMVAEPWLTVMATLAVGRRRAPALVAQFSAGLFTVTNRTNEALWELSRQALAHAVVAGAIRQGEFARLAEFPEGKGFLAHFDRFLAEYGHRDGTTFYLSTPSWRQEPGQVWRLLQGLLAVDALPSGGAERQAAAVAEVERGLRWFPWLRRRFLWLVERNRAFTLFREQSHFDMSRLVAALQAIASEWGRRLVERSLLTEPSELFFLTAAEVREWLGGAGPERKAARHLIARRRATYEAVNGRWQADLFQMARRGSRLKGVPVSGGVIRAKARLLRSEADWHRLRPGEIMVCPFTNPSWTPLFAIAAGVVAETGGAGSHAAIVAREYGLPAVMGLAGAMALIADGQEILLDGTTGRVSL